MNTLIETPNNVLGLKIAFISGKNWLDVLVKGAGKLFPSTDLKTFAPDQFQAAIAFASDLPVARESHGAKVTDIPTGRPDYLAFEISGKITDEVRHPLIDDMMAKFKTPDHVDLMKALLLRPILISPLFG